ncbi:hypothetical protein [Aneurinibacillus sp. UBA3580]|jgi:hypothetical protein|uniref:hypothetical protein n=1 Tax=Aneurinibacillus sp. UBA3580 TaxID=1946041 RepID=UPI00257FA5D1|nr:hypothetical protein [Aneurinibacillus sp. UBA3580]
MKLSRKLVALVLGLGLVGATGAVVTQPDVRADNSALSRQFQQQQTPPAPVKDQTTESVASDIYINKAMGFSLQLPASWENKYTVEQVEKNIDGFPAVIFINPKHSFELMEIVTIPENIWKSEGYDESLYLKLAERDGTIYAALFPSETLYEGDQEVTEITDMLNDMFEQIKTGFAVTK